MYRDWTARAYTASICFTGTVLLSVRNPISMFQNLSIMMSVHFVLFIVLA